MIEKEKFGETIVTIGVNAPTEDTDVKVKEFYDILLYTFSETFTVKKDLEEGCSKSPTSLKIYV